MKETGFQSFVVFRIEEEGLLTSLFVIFALIFIWGLVNEFLFLCCPCLVLVSRVNSLHKMNWVALPLSIP